MNKLGRPKVGENKLEKNIQVRFTNEEYEFLKLKAIERNRAISNLIRIEALKSLKN